MNSLTWKPSIGYLGAVKVVSIAHILYAAPKVLSMICTRPLNRDHNLIDRMRERMIIVQENLCSTLGERNWLILTNVIADNAWIGFLAVVYLTRGAPLFLTLDRGLNEAGGFISACVVSWLVRYGITQISPRTTPYIGFERR